MSIGIPPSRWLVTAYPITSRAAVACITQCRCLYKVCELVGGRSARSSYGDDETSELRILVLSGCRCKGMSIRYCGVAADYI